LKDCSLLYANDDEKELHIQTVYGDYPETGDVELTYVFSQTPHKFKSRILSQKADDTQNICYLKIRFPDKIDKTEKRKYFRMRPSKQGFVHIDVEFSRISESAYKMIMEYTTGKMSENESDRS